MAVHQLVRDHGTSCKFMNEPQAKICQNCRGSFTIEPGDFDFYKKFQVSPLNVCFDCGLQERLAFRGERNLHKRKCDAPGHSEELISIYAPSSPVTVYDHAYWWSDEWDPMRPGNDYNFSEPFFKQFLTLYREIPVPALFNWNALNSDYCNFTTDNKNCYLVFGGDFNEDCLYSGFNFHSKSSSDMYFTDRCELCYEVVDTNSCFKVFWSRYANDCTDSMFLYDCVGCNNCVGCVGLRSKNYCILNQPYSKEDYQKKIKELNLESISGIRAFAKQFEALKQRMPHRHARILKSVRSTGDNLVEVKNTIHSFDVKGPAEDLKNIFLAGWGLKDAHSASHAGHQSELVYNSMSVFSGCHNVKCSLVQGSSHDIEYSYNCKSCHNLFGCVGLRNKSYCILNKQYTKEEYETLVPKIRESMNALPYTGRKGRVYRYGDFFPIEFSHFAYNETIAQEYFPFTKEHIEREGLVYRDPGERHYAPTMKSGDVPETISGVQKEIVDEIIECEHKGACEENCPGAFRLIPVEVTFYKQLNVPIPRLCPNCRHYERVRKRNPMKLFSRTCQCAGEKSENGAYVNTASHFHDHPDASVGTPHPEGRRSCPNEFETSYAPDRPEIVYCETCYQQEIS